MHLPMHMAHRILKTRIPIKHLTAKTAAQTKIPATNFVRMLILDTDTAENPQKVLRCFCLTVSLLARRMKVGKKEQENL